jgi:peptidoglycan/xylan/chitin deacetylase (PgdA/CDA1 family)
MNFFPRFLSRALGQVIVVAGMTAAHSLGADALDPIVKTLPDGSSVRIVKSYPQGKMRAACQSFDDGTLGSDWPALDALRKRKLPATFFINSMHPQSKDAIKFPQRYAGFEIASHGANHKGLAGLTGEQVRSEVETDQQILGQTFGQAIDGFAYPYGDIPKDSARLEKLESQLRGFGLIYARLTGETKAYAPPADFIHWVPDCGFLDPIPKFVALPAGDKVRVRMCFMHSIDFARGQMSFETWEHILDELAADPAIWNGTMRDYARYVTALRALEVTDVGLKNDAAISVWVRANGKAVEVPAKTTLQWASFH